MKDQKATSWRTLRKYYAKVWKRARTLEGNYWLKRVGGELVFLLLGTGLIGLWIGQRAIFEQEGVGMAVIGATLVAFGVWRFLWCFFISPAAIDSEQTEHGTRLKHKVVKLRREHNRLIAEERDRHRELLRAQNEELLLEIANRNQQISELKNQIHDLRDRLSAATKRAILRIDFDKNRHIARDKQGTPGGVARLAVANDGNVTARNVCLKIISVSCVDGDDRDDLMALSGLLLEISLHPNGGRPAHIQEKPKDHGDVHPGFPLVFDAVSISGQPGNHAIYHSTCIQRELGQGHNRVHRIERAPSGVVPAGKYILTVVALGEESQSSPRTFSFYGTESDFIFEPLSPQTDPPSTTVQA